MLGLSFIKTFIIAINSLSVFLPWLLDPTLILHSGLDKSNLPEVF